MSIFTPEDIDKLSAEIDQQLWELEQTPPTSSNSTKVKSIDGIALNEAYNAYERQLPLKQSQVIAAITQENPESFLKKFARAAKQDLCEEGGLLYEQWKKFSDISNQDIINRFSVILAGMGIIASSIHPLVIAIAVIVIHIGLKAFCQEFSKQA